MVDQRSLAQRDDGFRRVSSCEPMVKGSEVTTPAGSKNHPRSSYRSFAANAARMQLHALAYNLGNFLSTLATEPMKDWSLSTLREKLIKIGAKSCQPRPLQRFSDGRGRRPTKRFCGRPHLDRGAALAADRRADMSVDRPMAGRTTRDLSPGEPLMPSHHGIE